jgi:hypothetical protein
MRNTCVVLFTRAWPHCDMAFCIVLVLVALLQVLRMREEVQNARVLSKSRSKSVLVRDENVAVGTAPETPATVEVSSRPSSGKLGERVAAQAQQKQVQFQNLKVVCVQSRQPDCFHSVRATTFFLLPVLCILTDRRGAA